MAKKKKKTVKVSSYTRDYPSSLPPRSKAGRFKKATTRKASSSKPKAPQLGMFK